MSGDKALDIVLNAMNEESEKTPTIVRLDILKEILMDFESNDLLKNLLGNDPLRKMCIVVQDNNLAFYVGSEDGKMPIETVKDEELFVEIVDTTLDKYTQ